MGRGRVVVLAWGLALVFAAPAHAAAPRWTAPQPLTALGVTPKVGMDDRGNALAVWLTPPPFGVPHDPARPATRVTASFRHAGRPFGAPFDLGEAGAHHPTVAMAPSGAAVVAWVERRDCDPVCLGPVRAVSRGPNGDFGPPADLGIGGGPPMAASGPAGDLAVAFASARKVDANRYVNDLKVATLAPDGTARLSTLATDVHGAGYAPHVALGGDGSALVTWPLSGDRGYAPLLAWWRQGRGEFAEPSRMTEDPVTGWTGVIDGSGRASVLWGQQASGSEPRILYSDGLLGGWTAPLALGHGGSLAAVADPLGGSVAYWRQAKGRTGLDLNVQTHVAFRSPGLPYSTPREVLGLGDAVAMDLDRRGNALALAANQHGAQGPLRAAAIPPVGVGDPAVQVAEQAAYPALAVNASGEAAAVFTAGSTRGDSVRAAVRPADRSAPAVAVVPVGRDRFAVRCDEACRLAAIGAARAAAVSRRPFHRGRASFRVTVRGPRRRPGSRVRFARLPLRFEDTAGNPRVVWVRVRRR